MEIDARPGAQNLKTKKKYGNMAKEEDGNTRRRSKMTQEAVALADNETNRPRFAIEDAKEALAIIRETENSSER